MYIVSREYIKDVNSNESFYTLNQQFICACLMDQCSVTLNNRALCCESYILNNKSLLTGVFLSVLPAQFFTAQKIKQMLFRILRDQIQQRVHTAMRIGKYFTNTVDDTQALLCLATFGCIDRLD